MSSRASTPAARRRASARPSAGPRAKAAPAPKRRAASKPRAGKRAPSRAPASNARPPARRSKARGGAGRPPARPKPPAAGPLKRLLRISLVAALAGAALTAGYLGWFRDSSLVAVRDVQITGVSSPDSERIETALAEAAKSMTTLHFDQAELNAAVSGFPTVVSVTGDPSFPNGLAIAVRERPPALVVEAPGRRLAAAADGTLLRGLDLGDAAERLPALPVRELPGGDVLEGEALEQAVVLGAAPEPLRPLIESVGFARNHGVEVVLRGEFPVRFGTKEKAAEKWEAAAAVLADPELETLTYVDVRVPERPSVGGAAPAEAPEEVQLPEEVATVAEDPAAVDPAL